MVVAGPALKATSAALSESALGAEITTLYRTHPDLGSYVVEGTSYTPGLRRSVFRACTRSGTAEMSSSAQESRLDACAPLIFYFYSYGNRRNVAAATKLANDLFSYGADVVHGPLDSAATLAGVLRAWGVVVHGATVASNKQVAASAAALLNAAGSAMVSQGSVRVTLVGRSRGQSTASERSVLEMDGSTSSERIEEPNAHAAIIVTKDGAYLSGDRNGLTTLLGLNAPEAKQAGSHWIEVPKGSKEYAALAAANAITALPASVVPGASDSVTVGSRFQNGRLLKSITWRGRVKNTSKALTETLELTSGAHPLPLRETTTAAGYRQTVLFTRWGQPVTVTAPPPSKVVSYGSLERG